jgi:hypothetical protein
MENTIIHESSEPAGTERAIINKLLKDKYGMDTVSGLPIWRVSWAQDHYEMKYGTYEDYSPGGIFIREVTEVRKVPKYGYLRGLYMLEQLVGIPDQNLMELPTATMSYECLYPFKHKVTEAYMPPKWEMCEFVINLVAAVKGQSSMRKYVSADEGDINGLETKRKRLDAIKENLYGNETSVSDALGLGLGVVVPNKQFTGE